jgi:hypothetical protein
MMDPDGYFIRQLDRLGQGLVDEYGPLAVPVIGSWLVRKGREAYHRGFVDALAAHPKPVILSVTHANTAASARTAGPCADAPYQGATAAEPVGACNA